MDSELNVALDSVLRLVGKNLLLYQQLEQLFKQLLAMATLSGSPALIRSNHRQHTAKLHTQTIGQLVRRYLLELYTQDTESSSEHEDHASIHLSIALRIYGESEADRQTLVGIITDRNVLVHHFFSTYDVTSVDGCRTTEQALKQQRQNVVQQIESVKSLIDSFQHNLQTMVKFLQSDEGIRYWRYTLFRDSRLAELLEEAAQECAKPNGWTNLATAEKCIRQQAPEELATLEQYFRQKNLVSLLRETGLFEDAEEITTRRGVRIVYRKKSEPPSDTISM